jgi:ribonuclease BN (tRNA processing enzyme)
MSVLTKWLATGLACVLPAVVAAADVCGGTGVALQVLGSGGPELRGERASASYLVWRDGRAVALVDAGGGSALRFAQSGARFADLAVVLFTHLHADHAADFPALVKSSFFEGRQSDLPVYGPVGNRLLPAVDRHLQRTVGAEGVYPYLSDMLDGTGSWRLVPKVVDPSDDEVWRAAGVTGGLTVSAVRVEHGPLPALAWRVDVAGRSITFSGDMNGRLGTLERLAENTDLLVAHHAIPEDSRDDVARRLHMPPSEIGRIAAVAKARRVVLAHIMERTEQGRETNLAALHAHYGGPVDFAGDLDCYRLE